MIRLILLINDNQFDFYRGMIKSKGTKNAIETLLNSNRVLVPGSVAVYDEWALKAGDFGGLDNVIVSDVGLRQGVYICHGMLSNKMVAEWFNLDYKEIDLIIASI